MDRRRFLALTVPTIVVLAACGGDDGPTGSPVDTTPGTGSGDTSAPGTDPAVGIEHPVGADEVVIRLTYEGGFVRPGATFSSVPSALVTGAGMLFAPGVTTEEYPGPLVRPVTSRTISEAGLQALLEIADADGLLAEPPAYVPNTMIADAPDTVLVLQAKGGSFRHQANALGFDTETDKDRKRFAAFVTALQNISDAAGADTLGPEEIHTATEYRIMSMPVDLANWEGSVPEPTVVEWPADAPVRLADIGECGQVDAAFGDPLFLEATELTFFSDADAVYQVFAAPLLPGDATC